LNTFFHLHEFPVTVLYTAYFSPPPISLYIFIFLLKLAFVVVWYRFKKGHNTRIIYRGDAI